MTDVTTRNAVARKRTMRGAAVAALCAAAFAGLAATPAQATDLWDVNGPVRYSLAEAKADIPATEAECRRQDGYVSISVVTSGTRGGAAIYYATTQCASKRDV
ncbi:hypothetical protein ABZ614_45700 [Streptomyces sp. NPDC013178]|uniref:hypothetical protein n=1 Tax=Streptomyces sp. NPDC013178 TaxID=3155118 RepID=UPI0033E92580